MILLRLPSKLLLRRTIYDFVTIIFSTLKRDFKEHKDQYIRREIDLIPRETLVKALCVEEKNSDSIVHSGQHL